MPKRLHSDDESFVKAPPNPYVRVSQHTKNKLVQMVVNGGNKVSSAAKILKIHDSTAKMTMSAFKSMTNEQQRKILEYEVMKKEKKSQLPKQSEPKSNQNFIEKSYQREQREKSGVQRQEWQGSSLKEGLLQKKKIGEQIQNLNKDEIEQVLYFVPCFYIFTFL